jgi:hypothetical protein
VDPFFHRLNRSLCFLLDRLDHLADLTGCFGGPFRQSTHLVGNYSKAAPLLAGTRRLDRCVERQQVGLIGDVLNGADDFTDLFGAGSEGNDRG